MAAAFGLVLLVFVTMGGAVIVAVPAFFALFAASLIYMIVAAVRASEGMIWEYPITTRWVT
jgi:uncharacterized Tic20 family protein